MGISIVIGLICLLLMAGVWTLFIWSAEENDLSFVDSDGTVWQKKE